MILELGARGEEVAHQRGGGDRRPEGVEQGNEFVGPRQLALEPRLVSAQPGRGAEDAPRLAHQPGAQGETPRLVGRPTGRDGGDELVHLRRVKCPPGEADAQRHILGEGPPPPLEGAPEQLAHPRVALERPHGHRFRDADLGLWRDIGDRGLDDGLLTERGENLRDVAQEGPARAEHEHAVAGQARVVVEEEGRPVQPDGGLAGAGSALDGEEPVQRGADDLILLGLDRRDDVEHLARPGPFELGQQGIAAAQAGGPGVTVAGSEEVVGDGDDGVAIDHDLPPPGQPQGILDACPIEGDSDGGPPVDHHGVGPIVLDVAPADVPRRTVLLVDAPEEQRARAVGEQRDPPRQCGDVIEVGVARRDEIREEPLGPLSHRGERRHRPVEVVLLCGDLRIGDGRCGRHLAPGRVKAHANACAQNSPVTPGRLPGFRLLYNPLSWYFSLSPDRALNL